MLNASPGACTYWGAMEGDEGPCGTVGKSIWCLGISETSIGQPCWIGSQH